MSARTKQAESAIKRVRGLFGNLRKSIADGKSALENYQGGLAQLQVGAGIINSMIQPAMSLEQALFTTQETFQGTAELIIDRSKQMADESIFSQVAIMNSYNKLNDSMTRYGVTAEQQHDIVSMSMDLAAAKGLDLMEATSRIESAMRGEAEASEYLGLTLSDTFMKTVFMNGALADSWETMDEATKAQHRFTAMMEQGSKFQGANQRALEGNVGAMKEFAVQQEEVRQQMGKALFPVIIPMLDTMVKMMEVYEQLPGPIQKVVPALILLSGAVMTLGAAMMFLNAAALKWTAAAAILLTTFIVVSENTNILTGALAAVTVGVFMLAYALHAASKTPIISITHLIIIGLLTLIPLVISLTHALFGSGLHEAFTEVAKAAEVFISPVMWLIDHLGDLVSLAESAAKALNKVPGVGMITGALGGMTGSDNKGVLGFATGGTVPGPEGQPRAAIVHGGEEVIPTGRRGRSGNVTNNYYVNGSDEFERRVISINQREDRKRMASRR
jgi:hypothetical protein